MMNSQNSKTLSTYSGVLGKTLPTCGIDTPASHNILFRFVDGANMAIGKWNGLRSSRACAFRVVPEPTRNPPVLGRGGFSLQVP